MVKPKDIRLIQFGAHVRSIRKGLNLSQDEVAARTNLTKSNLSEIERGNRNLAFTTLLEIAKGLDVEPKKLLDFKIDLGMD
ncbi:helix-turn-helix transcriptional regulator [Flavobacterium sp.]|uniref:helix-turn-helix domain-containing protein n=1 Tax=Flavobacterium sp. TaxID=239 RepID=UPI00120F375B|nr:helix-turn-helix transcriptional regulator [Flavobacterium sp.]RZJ71737.1 MAG: XRE family transcriptional regulator [Flavobacterium sp.]